MRPLSKALHRLGLTHAEFARLAGVSPHQVHAWATSNARLPGTIRAYLLHLETSGLAGSADRTHPLADGIYSIAFGNAQSGPGTATAVLRKGRIFGSDPEGGTFSGHYQFDSPRKLNRIDIRYLVPPGRTLVTGYYAGSEGASVDIVGEFGSLDTRPVIKLNVGCQPLDVELNYIGSLPNCQTAE